VALTFDLLTLKIRSVSAVTCSNSVLNFSDIDQASVEC